MKSSSEIAYKEIPLELKYCERCGGLWLRPSESNEVYCSRCAPEMAELPAPISKPAKKRTIRGAHEDHVNLPYPPQNSVLDLEAMGGLA
jgi:Zn-finger nucleic acid-binding protein